MSFPRYAKRIQDLVQVAKSKGMQIIAITDNYTSPIAPYGDIVLPCDSRSLSFHHSSMTAMLTAKYLISALSLAHAGTTNTRLDEIECILKTIAYHK